MLTLMTFEEWLLINYPSDSRLNLLHANWYTIHNFAIVVPLLALVISLILGFLNCDNQFCMIVWHFVYLAWISHVIKSFVDVWNSHPLSAMQNRSPIHVWTSEKIDIRNRQLINVSKLQSIDETVHEMDNIE